MMFKQREIFNIFLSDRRLIHKEMYKKGKLVRDFDTRDIVVVRKQVNLIVKYGVSHKLSLKTKKPYRVVEKATPISYWVDNFPSCEGPGGARINFKELVSRMEKIPSKMVTHKHAYGTDTIFSTM